MLVNKKELIDTYYEALLERNNSFVGIFYVGVKTTSVFCIATCRARKPKKENVEFFTTFKDALHNGYRPCKICKPTENASETPAQVISALKLLEKSPCIKITDSQLRENDISPEVVRRWFKMSYGVTFQSYQRMQRINNAYKEIREGKTTTESAFGSGYDSLSGFGYTFKKIIGTSPSNTSFEHIILINRLTTPIGPMFICATDRGVCLLEFVDRKMLETELKDLQKLLRAKILVGENTHITTAKKEISEYFAGNLKVFTVEIDSPGTEFQKLVWNSLKNIAYAKTLSYQEQSKIIGKENAIRAVATANGSNRISIIIPCHRVIGKDGSLTGYGGGLERKKWLLDHEQKFN